MFHTALVQLLENTQLSDIAIPSEVQVVLFGNNYESLKDSTVDKNPKSPQGLATLKPDVVWGFVLRPVIRAGC